MKNAIFKVIGIALFAVGAFVVLCGFFAAIGGAISRTAGEKAYMIFASGGFLIVGFLLLVASKNCLTWQWRDLMSVFAPHDVVMVGYISKFLSHVKTWHKCVALIALLFAAGLIWTNLLE